MLEKIYIMVTVIDCSVRHPIDFGLGKIIYGLFLQNNFVETF